MLFQLVLCFALVTTFITILYGAMWWNICTREVRSYAKRTLTSKHKKFGIISGAVILSCTLSWIPSSVLYYSNSHYRHHMIYYVFLGLHYMITVSNPVVYILGTQGNVGQAIVSTPMQYRRRISRPSMYNSETVHKNNMAGMGPGNPNVIDSRAAVMGSRPTRRGNCAAANGFSGAAGRNSMRSSIRSSARMSLELISESDDYRSTDNILG